MKTGSQKRTTCKNVDITQTFELQNGFFFGAETTLRMYFTVLENNVTIQKEQK